MPSGSTAAASPAAEPAELPPLLPPRPPSPQPLLVLQQSFAGLSLRGQGGAGAAQRQARLRQAGLASSDPPLEPGPGGAEEEAAAAAGDEADLDLELDEEELLAGEDAEEEDQDTAAVLVLSPSQPLSLLPPLGSVLLSPSFDVREPPAAGAFRGADDPQGVMAAMLSRAYGGGLGSAGGATGLSSEQAALLRRKSVNTTECVPVPSSEHVAEIVGRQAGRHWLGWCNTILHMKWKNLKGEQQRKRCLMSEIAEGYPVNGETHHYGIIMNVAVRKKTSMFIHHLIAVEEVMGQISPKNIAKIVCGCCKIKALRAKTNTYIKTPVRGEEPIFVVTGRKEDVAMAKREILSAAEHFSMIRASRNKNGPVLAGLPCTPNLPGQTTVQVRVPYRVVGLVVGPKGATIKRIQQQTHTYIVTPSRDKEPVFEVTGMPENVDRAREEIEMHIAMRTGNYIELSEENDFHYNGTDVSFEGGTLSSAWIPSNPVPHNRTRMISNYRNDSSSSLGSGSTDSYFGSNRLADFSPTSPFSTGNFWFGEALPSVGTEDLAADSAAYDSLPTPCQTIWTPFEPVNPLSGFGSDAASNAKPRRQASQPSTPHMSPTFPESLDHSLVRRATSDPPTVIHQAGLPVYIPAFSNGTNSYSSSNGGSTSSSPPESRQKHDCVICFESEVIAALVPCGHNLFCMECANKICEKEMPSCPVCQTAVTQAIQIHS